MANPLQGWTETRRANVAVLLLNWPNGTLTTITPPFLGSLGFGLADIGFLVAPFAVASLASRIPAGRIADGRQARGWFIGACSLFAVSLALYLVARETWSLLLVRLLSGLASGATTTLNFAAFLGASTGRERAKATAFFTAAMSAGYAFGNFASGILADQFGYGMAFMVAAVCPLLAMFVAPRAELASGLGASKPQKTGGLSTVLGRADVRAIPLFSLSVSFVHQTLATLFPLYILAMGQTLALVGTARSLQSLSNTVVRPFGEPLLRAFGLFGLACLGLAINAMAVASVPLIAAPLALFVAFVIIGACRGCAMVANTLSTAELSARGVLNRGTASSLISMGMDAGAILAPMVAGITAAQIGIGPALQVLPLGAALLGIGAMFQARHSLARGRRAAAPAPPAQRTQGDAG
jgi:MFS family permease